VEALRNEYPVNVLCNTLGVSLSGYYAWKKRPVSQHQLEDSQLAEHIHVAYQASRQVYGSPRIHAELRDQGIICSRRRVARLMRERGLSACRLRHRKITTHSMPGARVAPNRLNQEFTATRPNEKWAGDITAIWTYEGWLYLAVVLDLYSRRVIGWALAATEGTKRSLSGLSRWHCLVGTRQLACCFIRIGDRNIPVMQARALLANVGVTVSMSRTGNCYDNAVTESFFGTLKGECVERISFQTRGQARQIIFEYVECFYNRVRRHSTLGYVSPAAFEQLVS
jgi:putative transposase